MGRFVVILAALLARRTDPGPADLPKCSPTRGYEGFYMHHPLVYQPEGRVVTPQRGEARGGYPG